MSKLLPVHAIVALVLCALAGARAVHAADAPAAVPAEPPVAAHWVTRKFNLTYMGLTAHYSCDGLLDSVRDILLQLGARKSDMDVSEAGCIRLNGPSPMPGVEGSFSVLVPAEAAASGTTVSNGATASNQDGAPVQAQWRRVDLVRKLHYDFDLTGHCELLEQMHRQVLPLISSRNVDFMSTCFPHDAVLGGVTFKLDVLVPVVSPKGKAAAG